MDSTEAGSQSEPQPQQQHQPSQEQQQTEQQQQQQEDQQQQHQEQLSQQTHSQPLQQPVVASSTQASSQMDQSAISSSSPPSTSSMPCASPSSGGNSTQQAALQEQQQQPAQQTPSPQTPTSQQQQIQQQQQQVQQQQQQLQQQQQQQQQQQLHATQLHQALTSPSPAPQLTQMQPAQPQQAPTVQTQQMANHVQQLVSQQPSSTSMLAAICSSTSRMTSHISSPITTNTFVQSPSLASSPMTVSHSQGNSLISGQQMQLAQTSQMQVPVSTHITQNVNPHHTSTQQMSSLASQMSVSVSQIPQVQVIQQQPTTYHLQQLYHPSGQHMFLQPGNLTIQNMPTFHSSGGGLQLQLPTNTGGQMPISSVGNKTPIVSKGLAISSIASGMSAHQNQVMSSMKTGMNTGHQMIKPVMPSHQFAATNSHQIVIGPYGTVLPPTQQAILPANKAVLDVQKGKQFMLSHGTTIQPKTPLMPSTAMTSQFKTQLNASQLITQGAPATMIANQAQILSSFPALPQGLTWAAAPAGSLMGQNSSPIFIRGPGPQDLNFIQTSSPQLQTMSGNPIYVNQSGAVHMVQHGHASSTGNTAIAPSYITTTTAPTSQGTTNSTTTVQSVSLPAPVQHPPIAPAPAHAPQPPPTPTAIRPKPLRPATSVGTQTAPAVPQQKLPADSPVTKPVNSKTKTQLAKSTSTLLTKASSTTQTVPHQAPTQEIQTPNTQQANTTLTAQQITTKPFPTPSPFTAAGPFNQQMPNTASPSVTVPSTPMLNTAVSTTTATTQSTPVGRQTPTVNPHSPKVAPDSSLLKPTVTKKTTSQKSSGTQVGPTKTSVAVDTQTIPQMPLVPIASKSHVGPPNVAAKQMMMNHQSGESQSLMASPKPNTPPAKPCLKEKLNSLPSVSQTVPAKPRVEKKDAATEHNPDVINFYPPEILKTPPQKAIVKPQVLTHLIDGFVLHESYKPFPVNGNYNDTNGDSPVKRDDSVFASSNNGVNGEGNIRIQCVNCHKTVPKTRSKAKKGKRFCSAICSRQFVSKNTKMGLFNPVKSTLLEFEHPTSESSASPRLEIDATVEGNGDAPDDRKRMKMSKRAFANPASHETSASKNESVTQTKEPMKVNGEAAATTCPDPPESALSEDNSPSSIAGVYIPASGKNPIKWSVQDVYDFVKNLPGCQEYADEFRSQEIDGQALMLLKEDHLMSAMSMKLGPALKICSKINALKEKADSNKS